MNTLWVWQWWWSSRVPSLRVPRSEDIDSVVPRGIFSRFFSFLYRKPPPKSWNYSIDRILSSPAILSSLSTSFSLIYPIIPSEPLESLSLPSNQPNYITTIISPFPLLFSLFPRSSFFLPFTSQSFFFLLNCFVYFLDSPSEPVQ